MPTVTRSSRRFPDFWLLTVSDERVVYPSMGLVAVGLAVRAYLSDHSLCLALYGMSAWINATKALLACPA